MIKIDSGIKAPEAIGRVCKYPWKQMLVGDSFFVPCEKHDSRKISTTISSSAHNQKGRFSVRKVEGGVRCWRME